MNEKIGKKNELSGGEERRNLNSLQRVLCGYNQGKKGMHWKNKSLQP